MVGDYPSAVVQDVGDTPIYESREYILGKINETRTRQGLAPVALADQLNCAALTWAKRTWRLNICTHVDPVTNQQFWQRLQLCGGRLDVLSFEIVACEYPSIDTAINGWLRSPSHRQALLHPGMRQVGIGVAGDPVSKAYRWYTIVLSP